MKFIGLILAIVCALSAVGCQCCRCSERYNDHIDCASESSPKLDALYCPGLDVSRIGQPDWCEFGLNRYLCPCRCDECCE